MSVVLIALALAGPVAAMAPPLTCEYGDPSAGIGPYSHGVFGNGFVTYSASRTGDEGLWHLVEYCPEGRQLVLKTGRSGGDAAGDAAAVAMLDEMLWGEESYSQSEMLERLRAIGAVVEIRRVTYRSCACANQ
jgi:hypothetical protein